MPRIRCLYVDCTFLDGGYCSASNVEIDPDMGCATYAPIGETDVIDDEWEDDTEDDSYDEWDTEDLDMDDDDDDFGDDEDDW